MIYRASVLVYYKDSFHYKSERDTPLGMLELSHCTGIYSSSSDDRIFTVRSVDTDFTLKARFEDSVEGWKTAIQCSWDLARKDIDIQDDEINEDSVLNQVIDLELKLHSLTSPDKEIAERLKNFKPVEKPVDGYLKRYRAQVTSASKGAVLGSQK